MVKRVTEKQLAAMSNKEFMEVYRRVMLEAWYRMAKLFLGDDTLLPVGFNPQPPIQTEASP